MWLYVVETVVALCIVDTVDLKIFDIEAAIMIADRNLKPWISHLAYY